MLLIHGFQGVAAFWIPLLSVRRCVPPISMGSGPPTRWAVQGQLLYEYCGNLDRRPAMVVRSDLDDECS